MELQKNISAYIADTKAAILQAIKKCDLSRHQIADRMNETIGGVDPDDGPITVALIDSWTKKDERRTSFFKYLPIFCLVTNSPAPLQAYLSSLGMKIVSGKLINIYELGESELKRIDAERQRKTALSRLGWFEDNGANEGRE